MHSPFVKKVDVKRSGRVRRSRLYYLRERKGKATRLKEVLRGRPQAKEPAATPAPEPAPEPEAPEAAEE